MRWCHRPSSPRYWDDRVRWSGETNSMVSLYYAVLPVSVKLGPSVSSVSTLCRYPLVLGRCPVDLGFRNRAPGAPRSGPTPSVCGSTDPRRPDLGRSDPRLRYPFEPRFRWRRMPRPKHECNPSDSHADAVGARFSRHPALLARSGAANHARLRPGPGRLPPPPPGRRDEDSDGEHGPAGEPESRGLVRRDTERRPTPAAVRDTAPFRRVTCPEWGKNPRGSEEASEFECVVPAHFLPQARPPLPPFGAWRTAKSVGTPLKPGGQLRRVVSAARVFGLRQFFPTFGTATADEPLQFLLSVAESPSPTTPRRVGGGERPAWRVCTSGCRPRDGPVCGSSDWRCGGRTRSSCSRS